MSDKLREVEAEMAQCAEFLSVTSCGCCRKTAEALYRWRDELRALLPTEPAPDREDAERLDWLEKMANKRGGLLLHDGSETGRTGLGLRPGMLNRTLREAIDAARQERS